MKFSIVICSALVCIVFAQVFVDAAPLGGSTPGKAAVDACSSLTLTDENKTNVTKAVDDAVAEAKTNGGSNEEIAKKGLRAAGQVLEKAGVKGLTPELEKTVQQAIQDALGSTQAPPAAGSSSTPSASSSSSASTTTTTTTTKAPASPVKLRKRRDGGGATNNGFYGNDDNYGPVSAHAKPAEPTSKVDTSPILINPAAI